MKKINLFKSLALLGVVALTSVCVVETVLLMNDKKSDETDTKFDISTLDQYIINEYLSSDNPNPDELLQLIKNIGISPTIGGTNVMLDNINDLVVVEGSVANMSFILTTRNNSTTYEANKYATIYFSTGTPIVLSNIITTTPDLFLDKYVDETTTKANILINLKNQYPSLNINDLVVNNVTNLNDEVSNAQVSARTGSMLYAGAVNVTYYTSGAAVLTYAQTTLVPGNSNVLPTFTFKGESVTPTYTCSTAVAPITFTAATGAFAYATGTEFNGGLYQVKASYTDGVNIFVAYANVFAQPNKINFGQTFRFSAENKTGWIKIFTINHSSGRIGSIKGSISVTRSASGGAGPSYTLVGDFFLQKALSNTTVTDATINCSYYSPNRLLNYVVPSINVVEIWLYSNNAYDAGICQIDDVSVSGATLPTVTIENNTNYISTAPTDVAAFRPIGNAPATTGGVSWTAGAYVSGCASSYIAQSGKIVTVTMRNIVFATTGTKNTSQFTLTGVSSPAGSAVLLLQDGYTGMSANLSCSANELIFYLNWSTIPDGMTNNRCVITGSYISN